VDEGDRVERCRSSCANQCQSRVSFPEQLPARLANTCKDAAKQTPSAFTRGTIARLALTDLTLRVSNGKGVRADGKHIGFARHSSPSVNIWFHYGLPPSTRPFGGASRRCRCAVDKCFGKGRRATVTLVEEAINLEEELAVHLRGERGVACNRTNREMRGAISSRNRAPLNTP